jgi:hypothetical protein
MITPLPSISQTLASSILTLLPHTVTLLPSISQTLAPSIPPLLPHTVTFLATKLLLLRRIPPLLPHKVTLLATKLFLVLIVLYPSHSSFFLLRFEVYFIYLLVKYNFDKITTFEFSLYKNISFSFIKFYKN